MKSCLRISVFSVISSTCTQHSWSIILQCSSQEELRRKAVKVIYKRSRYSEAMDRRNDLWDHIEHERSLIAIIDEKINKLQDKKLGSYDPSIIVPPHIITQ